jgi:hypothetical protein
MQGPGSYGIEKTAFLTDHPAHLFDAIITMFFTQLILHSVCDCSLPTIAHAGSWQLRY